MKTFARNVMALLLLAVSVGSPVMAQDDYTTVPVVPGSKGELPTIPQLPAIEGNHIAGLWLRSVCFHQWSLYDAYEADLYFPQWTAEEASYCTLQQKRASTGTWETLKKSDDTPEQFSSGAAVSPRLEEDTEYRIVLHEGTKDGFTSNVVSAKMPTKHYTFVQSAHYTTSPAYVGEKVTGSWVEAQRKTRTWNTDRQRYDYTVAEQCYTYNTNYYHRQWYRLNPNTSEMFAIEGATETDYVPTADDYGWELIEIITGDEVHCSYYYAFGHGIVKTYILASVDYVGNDGFILNTDYVLPEGGKDLHVDGGTMVNEEYVPASVKIVERQPGQYAFYAPMTDANYGVAYGTDDIWDSSVDFPLMVNRGTEENPWLRPVQIYSMMFLKPIVANSSSGALIDIFGRNIDNELVLTATYDASQLTPEQPYMELFAGKYYLKSRATGSTLATYYPNVLMWEDATAVEPGATYDEAYNMTPNTFNIEDHAAPAPMTGSGIIEGSVSEATQAAAARRAAVDAPYTVYLKQKGGDVVAVTETDAMGKYAFQNVSFGTYQVLVNMEGCTLEQATEVTLDASKPTVSNVNYVVEDNTIKPSSSTGIRSLHSNTTKGTYYDLNGRQLLAPQRGLNIVHSQDGKVSKVIIK